MKKITLTPLFLILLTAISLAQIYYFNVSVDKTTLKPGESYTLTVYFSVDQGLYYIYLNNLPLGSFSTYGESGYRTFSLTAPNTPGTYTFNVKLQRAYTGESSTSSYTITVVSSTTTTTTTTTVPCTLQCPTTTWETREYVGCENNDNKKYAVYQHYYRLVLPDCYCKEEKVLLRYEYEKVTAPSSQCTKTYKGCVNKQKVWEETCTYYGVVNCQVVKVDEKTVGYTENVDCCSDSDCPKVSIPNGWKEGTCQNFSCSYTIHCLEGYELVNGECRPKIYPPQPPSWQWLVQIFQAIIDFFKSLFGFK